MRSPQATIELASLLPTTTAVVTISVVENNQPMPQLGFLKNLLVLAARAHVTDVNVLQKPRSACARLSSAHENRTVEQTLSHHQLGSAPSTWEMLVPAIARNTTSKSECAIRDMPLCVVCRTGWGYPSTSTFAA